MAVNRVVLVANTSWFLFNFRLSFAKILKKAGVDVLLCSPEDRFASQLQEAGFRWKNLNLDRQSVAPWTELPAIRSLARIYRQEQPQLVHHFTIKPVIYGSLAARWMKIPHVINEITGRGYIFHPRGSRGQFLIKVVQALYRQAFSHPHHAVVFENQEDLQDFQARDLLTSPHIHLIEGAGVDVEYFFPAPPRAPNDIPLAVMPARMLWEKGVGVLVDAVSQLPGEVKLRVALVGDPDPGNPGTIDTDTLKAWQEQGTVEWWGFQGDIRQVYWDCDMVVLPSFSEGVPSALQEAAACGLPLITTDVPGCRNVVHHGRNGLLVPPNDPAALAEALTQMAEDPALRNQMGAASRELAVEKFNRVKINAQRLAVYEQLLGVEL